MNYGGVSGLISFEDVVEEIVGEINDEYDEEEPNFKQIDEQTFDCEAKILLIDFFKITDVDEDDFEDVSGEADTLGGLILEIKGEFPVKDEVISYKKYEFTILEVNDRRILKSEVSRGKKRIMRRRHQMINRIVLSLVCFSFLLTNCTNSPSTQEKPTRDYLSLDTAIFPFRMQYPAESKIVLRKNEPEALWFDIVYPERKSTIYCTYFPVRGNFRMYDEDVRRFVYRHTVVANSYQKNRPLLSAGEEALRAYFRYKRRGCLTGSVPYYR